MIIYGPYPNVSSADREKNFWEDLEPGIRDLVRHVRNCGFNTTMSCHHKMYVEFSIDVYVVETVREILNTIDQWLEERGYATNIDFDFHGTRLMVWLNPETHDMDWDEIRKKFPDGQKFRVVKDTLLNDVRDAEAKQTTVE